VLADGERWILNVEIDLKPNLCDKEVDEKESKFYYDNFKKQEK